MPGSGQTPRQTAILAYLREYITHHGYSPTYREIADAMGIKEANSVCQTIEAMEGRGLITREKGNARVVRLVVETKTKGRC